MKRFLGFSLSMIGLSTLLGIAALSVGELRADESTDQDIKVSLSERFKDSFMNGSGGLNHN